MKPSEIKWENYLPIPWGRTKRFLLLTSGLLTYLLFTIVGSVPVMYGYTPKGDLLTGLVVFVFPALLFHGLVANTILGGRSMKEWYEMYHARNVVGYDAVYHLLDNGDLDCEVVAGNVSSSSFERTLWGWWGLRIPINHRRSGRFFGCHLPAVVQAAWRVAWSGPRQAMDEHSFVLLTDAGGKSLKMHLMHAMRLIKRYFIHCGITSCRELLDTILCDLASLEQHGKTIEEENKTLDRQKQELERRLCNAHEDMRRAVLDLAHSDRIGKSQLGQEIRMYLACTLYNQTDETATETRELYAAYMMKASRPPRVRTTTTTT